jgi:hypothetical protein
MKRTELGPPSPCPTGRSIDRMAWTGTCGLGRPEATRRGLHPAAAWGWRWTLVVHAVAMQAPTRVFWLSLHFSNWIM